MRQLRERREFPGLPVQASALLVSQGDTFSVGAIFLRAAFEPAPFSCGSASVAGSRASMLGV